jgi:hypothetical protein
MVFRMPEGYFVNVDRNGRRRDGPAASATEDAMLRIQSGDAAAAQGADAASIRGDLRGWHVRTVVVGPMLHREDAVALFARVLGRPPLQRDGVDVWVDIRP